MHFKLATYLGTRMVVLYRIPIGVAAHYLGLHDAVPRIYVCGRAGMRSMLLLPRLGLRQTRLLFIFYFLTLVPSQQKLAK